LVLHELIKSFDRDNEKKKFVKGRKNEVGRVITTNKAKYGKSDFGATKFKKWKK